MNAEISETHSFQEERPSCTNCKTNTESLQGKVPLCDACRKQFIRYPIPVWIKAFGTGILALLVFSLFSLPKQLETGVHLKRGKDAIEQHRYVTAQQELKRVVAKEPGDEEAWAYLLIAAAHNQDMETIKSCLIQLEHKNVSDKELFNQAQMSLSHLASLTPSDSLETIREAYQNNLDSIPEEVYKEFLRKYPYDMAARYGLASQQFGLHNYRVSDSLVDGLLQELTNDQNCLSFKAAIKRELNQFDSAHYYAKKMIEENREDPYAYSTDARTFLKEHKDGEAYTAVQKALALNPANGHAKASLALIYHYKNDFAKRDALVKAGMSDSVSHETFEFVSNIITGKEKFRD